MKKVIDKDGRILYKFSSSAAKGGNVYIHKSFSIIENKQGLRNALNAVSKKLNLIDSMIKIYDKIFFFFFHIPKKLAPAAIIDSIRRNIGSFAEWDEEYAFTAVYDLQEKFLRKDLKNLGFDYEKG